MVNDAIMRRSRIRHRLETVLVWLLGHVSRIWPILVLAVIVMATSDALRRVHPAEVQTAIRDIEPAWLAVALAFTIANIAVMGAYDVFAFRHTRAGWRDRWRYGSVAFAWSNFLTLGPLAGPAIRFWLYRPWVDEIGALPGGIVSVGIAFLSGLAGWTLAALVLVGAESVWSLAASGLLALPLTWAAVMAARGVASKIGRLQVPPTTKGAGLMLALIGWLDWLLGAGAFLACLEATGERISASDAMRSFFLGQTLGLVSLVPGGLGTADAFWITHVPLDESIATAALVAYRSIYYVLPWAAASLVLLAWASRRQSRRVELARRLVAALVGVGGGLILLSAASPAVHGRLLALERLVPLPLVEAGQINAVLSGVLLLVLARGLARGYRAALRGTTLLLALAGLSALLKGLDWEETVLMGLVAAAAWSQSSLFDRPSRGAWLERRDLGVTIAALVLFLVFGGFAHRVTGQTVERWGRVGYRIESTRFVRSAAVAALAVSVIGLYILLRVPVGFQEPSDETIDRALVLHDRFGRSTTPLTLANRDKEVWFLDDRGFCLYRVVGPYLVVLGDPVVESAETRGEFLDSLCRFAVDIDRRLVFYQISLDWIAPLHDRGFAFFKLGEEALVSLDAITLDGHAGKMYRQILRRGERDGLTFDVLSPDAVAGLLTELRAVSNEWLRTKGVRERQFSIGFFEERYVRCYPWAIVRETDRRIVAFANLLEGPFQEELSVDLMRYRADAPRGVMDFLFVSLFLHGQTSGFRRFNLGMAPLAKVGEARGAHLPERLAHLLFQHGEGWYNFQGLRSYKEKFDPQWIPRYMAYPNAWEWSAAIVHVSALIAGGWSTILRGRAE